jgi:hypothetical protein
VVPAGHATVPVQIAAGARMSLEAPTFGQMSYGSDVELRVRVCDLTLGPGKGWISVRVDGRQAAFLPRDHSIIGPFATGLHVLELELFDGDRRPLQPPVKLSSQFRVGGATVPSLAITSPASGTSVEDGAIDIAFAVADIELDPVGLRGRAQAERGAVVVSVDGRVRAIATSSPVRFIGLTPGAHTIEAVLTGLDLLPLAPRISDRIEIVVE